MVKIHEIEVKSVMTKSNLPVADFSVNPYVGCRQTSCCATLTSSRPSPMPVYRGASTRSTSRSVARWT